MELTKALTIAIALPAIAACGILKPLGDASEPLLMGTPDRPTVDHHGAARAAAGQALIQKGLDSQNPAEAQHWINLGVGLLR